MHLFFLIERFLKEMKDDKDLWIFRYTTEGKFYWVNHALMKAVKEYPYLSLLRKEIEQYLN